MKRLTKLALALTMLFTALNMTAQPAEAINCLRRFLGCQFSGYTYIDIYECCTYTCPDGSEKIGACGIA